MMARLGWYLDPSSPHQLKKPVEVGPPLTKLSESAHEFQVDRNFSIAEFEAQYVFNLNTPHIYTESFIKIS